MIDESDFQLWKQNPITKCFLTEIKKALDYQSSLLQSGVLMNHESGKDIKQTCISIGTRRALKAVLEIKFDSDIGVILSL